MDALLIGVRYQFALGIHNAVEQLRNPLLGFREFVLQALRHGFLSLDAAIPPVAQHFMRALEQHGRGPQRTQEGFKLTLDRLSLDGLAVQIAAFVLAVIVRVVGIAPLRPAGGERIAAASAHHKSAQWKIFADVFTPRGEGIVLQSPLNGAERLEADQGLVLALDHLKAPHRDIDITSIEHVRQKLGHALRMHMTVISLGIARLLLKKAHDFAGGLKLSDGESDQGLSDDFIKRLIPDQEFSVAFNLGIAIANGLAEYPVSVLHTGAHAVLHLPRVRPALVL